MPFITTLPAYRSHKVVRAAKIKSIQDNGPGRIFGLDIPLDIEPTAFHCQISSLVNKPVPEVGWYLVVYEDGYFSFSPAQVFEEGYSKV